jgi:Rieske Fe-S protein
VGLALGPCAATAQDDPASSRPKTGDFLVKVDDATLTPLAPRDIEGGAPPMMAWARDPRDGTVRNGSRLNRVLLLRVAPERMSLETRVRSAESVVAYTAICTHTGCEVIDYLVNDELLHCPCHYSKFDPRDGARVVDGPAPRALPALPLTIVTGRLVVAGPFSTRVGFEQA